MANGRDGNILGAGEDLVEVLPSLAQASLRDRVIEVVETGILDGRWAAGERLPTEIELATRLGVSRTVVRDALRVLEARGLIDVRRGSGTRVRASTRDAYVNAAALLLLRSDLTVGDVFEAREALESHLCILAAVNHTDEDVRRISRALSEMEHAVATRDSSGAASAHVRFHTELLRATRLPALEILLQPLQQMMMATSLVPTGMDVTDPRGWRVDAHTSLRDAVASSSRQAVIAALDEHWAYIRGDAFADLRALRIGAVYSAPAQLVSDAFNLSPG
jgi:DNA-binding FadR family transcriptional regulator